MVGGTKTAGAAAYQRWKIDQHVHELTLKQKSFKAPPTDSGSDDHDDDYTPITQAMDEMNLELMMLSGITLEEWAAKVQKQRDKEELREREASRVKVSEWIGCIADNAPEESEVGVKNT